MYLCSVSPSERASERERAKEQDKDKVHVGELLEDGFYGMNVQSFCRDAVVFGKLSKIQGQRICHAHTPALRYKNVKDRFDSTDLHQRPLRCECVSYIYMQLDTYAKIHMLCLSLSLNKCVCVCACVRACVCQ